MTLIVDKLDERLLTELYHDWRSPFSVIARKAGLSRDQVIYRYSKLRSQGIIRKHLLIPDYASLGYPLVAIIVIRCMPQSRSRLIEKIRSKPFCLSCGLLVGAYSIFVNTVFPSLRAGQQALSQLRQENEATWLADEFIIPEITDLFDLKPWNSQVTIPLQPKPLNRRITIDALDKKLLLLLAQDARMPLVQLARRLGSRSDTLLYRLRNLRSKGIIKGGRLQVGWESAGLHMTQIWFETAELDTRMISVLRAIAKSTPVINTLIIAKGRCKGLVQILHADVSTVIQTSALIEKALNDKLIRLEYSFAESEGEINPLPFF